MKNRIIKELRREDRLLHRKWSRRIAYFSLILAIVAGVLKEAKDAVTPDNYWDWWDILADVWGILEGTIVRVIAFVSLYIVYRSISQTLVFM